MELLLIVCGLYLFFKYAACIFSGLKNRTFPALPHIPKPPKKYTAKNLITYTELNRFIFSEPHILIGGTTGSGKSNLLQWILLSLTGTNEVNRFILIDIKRVELSQWRHVPGVQTVTDSKTACEVLKGVCAYIDTAYRKMERNGERKSRKPYTVIVIDEIADLMLSDERKSIEKALQRIAQIGRACNVKLIAATQILRHDIITLKISSNITGRIALRCKNGLESRQIIGVPLAADLPQYGEGYFSNSSGLIREVIPLITDEQIKTQIENLTP